VNEEDSERDREEEEEEEEGLFRADTVNWEVEEEEEEEEEGLFKANAVNEEDPERDRTPSATALPRCRRRGPPYYVPEGDSPLSLQATARRRRRRRRKVYSKLTQWTERWNPSATALPGCRWRDPPYYVPEGDSPLSLQAGG
jgi:hypothetical protein